jgi:hypothetical protein
VIPLPLPLPGEPADRDLDGARYVLVSGAVADRVLRARDRYPLQAAFYDELGAKALRVLRVEPGGGTSGPWVALYRL